jgi:tetratricopeptide (TPR) repeat protein
LQTALASNAISLGNLLKGTDRPGQAEVEYRQALEIFQKLAADFPAAADIRSGLAASHGNLANMLALTGKQGEAEATYRKALAFYQKLAEDNPGVTEFDSEPAICHDNLARFLKKIGKPDKAETEYRAALAIWQRLANVNAKITDYQRQVVSCHNNIADLLRQNRQPAEALKSYDHALEVGEPLARANPKNIWYLTGPAYGLRGRGLVRLDLADLAGAAVDTRRSLAIWDGLPTRSEASTFEAACCHATLSDVAGREGSGVPARDAPTEADQAIDLLRKALVLGFRDADTVRTESALDPLRSRADFKKLLLELEAKAGLPKGKP